jgi:hypothetical protein
VRSAAALHFERARPADGIVEELELNRIANGKIIERSTVAHVAAMKKHLAMVREPDEAVALSHQQRDDSARARHAATLGPPWSDAAGSRRRSSNDASLLAHVTTSAVPTVGDAMDRRRSRRFLRISVAPR